jgi:hypothetical protein
MKKYIIYFSIAYLAAMVLMAVIIYFLDMPNGASVASIMVAGFATASKFVQDQQRVPNAEEKKQLIWGCLISSIMISLISSVIVVLAIFKSISAFSVLSAVPLWVIALAFGFTLLIHYALLALSFGWMSKNVLKGLEKQKKRKS